MSPKLHRDLELQQRTAEDQGSCHEAEGRQHPLFQLDVAQQEAEVDFGVVEIAHQRREREQEECQRNEICAIGWPSTVAIASFTRGAPVTPPSSPTPEERTTNAVKVQIDHRVMKTESI